MTESTIDLTHGLLVHIADFLRKLPADQLSDLLAGEAKLALIPKGARVATPAARAASAVVNSSAVAADLTKIGDRAAANQYIADLKLTVPQLKQLCKEFGIPVKSSAPKTHYVSAIVELMVGRRSDSDAIMRNSSAR